MDTTIDIQTFRGMLNNAQNKIQYENINISADFINAKVRIEGKLFDIGSVEAKDGDVIIDIYKENE